VLAWLKPRAFWLCSRICITLYRFFPVFGPLRGVLAVARQDDRILIIERNDGLGLSLPGGLIRRHESDEQALAREVLEETGLRVSTPSFLMRYASDWPFPLKTVAFEVEVSGTLRGSWEGAPRWELASEVDKRIVRNQKAVLQKILRQG